MKTEIVRGILRENKLKVTPVRVQVLKALLESDTALSHSDISDILSELHIDKVTLYRTLNNFTDKGIVHKVATEDRNWLYAIMLENDSQTETDHSHAHFICDDCERVYCFPIKPETDASVKTIKPGFLVKEQEIRLHGLCPSCQ